MGGAAGAAPPVDGRGALAWGRAVLVTLGAVADTVLTTAYRSLWSQETVAVHGWPFVNAAVVGSAVMGALIISRYPGHPIGWLISVVGTTGAVSIVAEAYGVWVV